MKDRSLITPGKWYTEFDENGNCTVAVYDASYRKLLGFEPEDEFDDAMETWRSRVHPDDAERLNALLIEGIKKHPEGMDFDIEYRMMTKSGYRWFHDYAHCSRREDGSLSRCDGVVFDIQEVLENEKQKKETEVKLAHEQLRSEVLNFLVNNEGDPIELLKNYAERIRALINCDQVIYRDLEETRIMVNSPAIEKTWAVPIEFCKKCEHFNAHHPMYAGGYTEMENCQEGWHGIPVYKDCPIKSSLTRIVYCDGEIAGYLAIHFVQEYHRFTDVERATIEEFTRVLSMSLSRYEAKKRASELSGVKKMLSMTFALSDQFDPVIVLEPESGVYDWLMSVSENVAKNTSMTRHGESLYKNIGVDAETIIHEEDRAQFKAFYSKENMLKIAETGETQEIENRWFIQTEGRYRWKYNKAVRMLDENGKVFVVIGVTDTTEAKEKEEVFNSQKEQLEKQQAIAENSARFFALEDSFESLYDVEMESGRYVSYVKGDFYQSNVTDKLVKPSDYFEDLRANVEAVVYEEDRIGLCNILTRESIRRELAENDHFDYYYRINTEKGPLWFKLRVVYKDDDEKNVIIGVFNASDDVEAKQIAEQNAKLEEALVFTNFFLGTYLSAYYVDLETLSCKIYKRTRQLERDFPINSNYLESITEYINRDVHPDDRKILLELVQPQKMKKALKKKEFYTQIFRDVSDGVEKFFRMQIIRGSDERHAAFGFTDITGEVREQRKRRTDEEESRKLIDSIVASYNIAYAVNMKTDSFRLLRMDDFIIGHEEKFNTFSEAKNFFINLLAECDKGKMRHELDYDTIREKLKENKSYNIEYRVPINRAMIWHIMNVTLIDGDYVAIGFAKRDVEITQKHLEDKRYSEYFALYEIDIDSGMMKIVKDSPYYEIELAGTAIPYKPAMLKFASGLDDDPRKFFERLADLENVKKDFATEDKMTYTYQSNNVGDKNWVDCTSYVTLRHDDGTPAMFTFGFSLVDTLGVYRQELQSKYKLALDVVSEEKHRNDLLHDIIHSGKWSFKISADDKIVGADYSKEVMHVINNDFSTGITSWVQIVHPDDAKATFEAFSATIADHSCNTPYDVAYRMADRNGVYHWFHSAGRIVRHEDGTGEFFGIHIDITSQIEEQLKQQKMLEDARVAADAANQAKSNFLFNMSHDIRTPMNAITGFTTMAKKHLGDEKKVADYLDKIDISGQQLLALINQVLEMARIESGKVVFDEKPMDIRKEFNSMVTILSEQANAKCLKFNCSFDNVEHNFVLADVARIGSIVLNIVGNAMKYTPEGGCVCFTLNEVQSRKAGCATFVFVVSDTGIGMSADYLKELYVPFSREKNSTVSKIQGTGLGLSIVKNFVDLLGGNIVVQSEHNKGTRFEITVDLKIDEKTGGTVAEEDVSEVSFKNRRVLLVDDNEMNREIARDVLEEQEMIVEDACDGDVAIAKVKSAVDRGEPRFYDFILMDVQMPKMSGYDATKAIRAILGNVHIPIIAMTANAFEEDRQDALAAGMDEHLAKPIDVQMMFVKIAKLLK